MGPETKNCKSCGNNFVIEPDDFGFYERIKVPPPTRCPECRMKRRMLFRNEFNMHKCKCALCGKETISHYSSRVKFPIYCQECWWSDK
ncbi:MAG: zinc-ribbon domain containing protein, partial [Candidatus Liptonbacteria bacterium]